MRTKKRSSWHYWWQRFRFKYKISIIDELRFDEIFSINLSPLSATLIGFTLFVLITIVISTLIIATPLKNLLPGYLDISARRDIVAQAVALDSLEQRAEQYDFYLEAMKKVIAGDVVIDSLNSVEQLKKVNLEDLQPNTAEKKFREKYERGEYDVPVASIEAAAGNERPREVEAMTLARPCTGTIMATMKPDNDQPGIVIRLKGGSPIMAVASGKVAYISPKDKGVLTIILQHSEGYMSIYNGIANARVRIGQAVNENKIIGGTATGRITDISFSLWKDASYIDPQSMIVF